MSIKKNHIFTIGIVLSSVPRYSETFFRNKIKGLQNNGHKVILFVDYKHPNDADFNCEIIAAPSFNKHKISNSIKTIFVLLKLLIIYPKKTFKLYSLDKRDGVSFKKRIRNLALHSFFFKQKVDWLHYGFGMLATHRENVAEAINAKMAVSFRGYDLYLSPLKHKGCYDSLFTKNVKYHVLSHEMKQTLLDYGISNRKIQVITPAIDVNFFKNENDIPNNTKLQLATVARLHWKKGLEYTLEALALLKNKGIDFKYTIIGAGEQKERLVFAAHQLGILQHIVFSGKLAQNELRLQLQKADIYLQFSIQEGFCNAVLEAQAMGLLCIVSNAEGLSENVLHNETGWVMPKRNIKALAERIIEVNNLSLEDKKAIKLKATKRVQETFNLEQQNEAFLKFYNSETVSIN